MCIERDKVIVGVVILVQDQAVFEQDWGAASAEFVLEWAHRFFPQQVTGEVITQNSVTAEKHKYAFSVTRGRGSCRVSHGMYGFQFLCWCDLAPEQFSCLAIHRDGGKFFALSRERGQENVLADNARC